ncbi:MAG TPA: tetratricopeptide repeat protein [Candidatus Acidoferrales bacterium]|nr:tetratricopeptide repeat protein [Candidatus Acidoferrales bacterium]
MEWERFQNALDLIKSNDLGRALAALDSLQETAVEDDARAMILIGRVSCYLKLRRPKEARQSLSELQRILPRLPESDLQPRVKLFEARILNWEGNDDEAVKVLEQILVDYPELLRLDENRDLYGEVQAERGRLLAQLGRRLEARPILEEALVFDTELNEVHYHLGACYIEVGDLEKAREHFLTALRIGLPNLLAGRAHYHLGCIYIRNHGYARAKQHLEAAEPLATESGIPLEQIHSGLADACRALELRAREER